MFPGPQNGSICKPQVAYRFLRFTSTPWIRSLWSNSQCCVLPKFLKRLIARIRSVSPKYHKFGSWSLLHDNARPYTVYIIQQYLAKNQIIVINHPSYSPNQIPADFFLFSKVKLHIKAIFFQDVNAIQTTVTKYSKAIPIDEYAHSLQSLYRRSTYWL